MSLGLLKLLASGFRLSTMVQEGLVCQSILVLQVDPIPCLMIFNSILEYHYFHCLFNLPLGEPTFANEGIYSV